MSLRIETDRLIIREYREDDWVQAHEYCQNPDVVRFMIWGPNTEEQTKHFVRTAVASQNGSPRSTYEMAVELKETGRIVGGIGMRVKDFVKRVADIGYCYNSSVWGMGIGTEAARAMIKFGFTQLKLHRIWATCDTDNIGSEAIMRKNHMRKEAHYKLDELIKGNWRDTYLYAILEDEWQALPVEESIRISIASPQGVTD